VWFTVEFYLVSWPNIRFYGGYYVVGVWWWYIAGGEEDDGLEMGPEQGLLKVGWMAFDLKISEEDESLGFFLVGISQKQRR